MNSPIDKRPATEGSARARTLPYGLIGIGAVLVVIAVYLAFNQAPAIPEGQRTVGDAVGSGAYPGQAQTPIHPDKSTSSKLIDLANSLGIPESSLPGARSVGTDRAAQRKFLEDILNEKVANKTLDPQDMEAILNAYDMGLVDAPYMEAETKKTKTNS